MASVTPCDNPEIGATIDVDGIATNYHDTGAGTPVLLLHGSGPGVSAWANWRATMPALARQHRVLAPDLVGFGYTGRPAGISYDKATWQAHILGFLDALGLDRVSIVGNSYGGGLAMALAISHPDRVERLVLMGSAALHFEITPALDEIWGLDPTVAAMRRAMDLFAWNRSLVSHELAELRHQAFARPGVHEAYAAMFPAPRQRWVDAMASDPDDVRAVQHQTLVIHGREDQVVPVSASLEIFGLLPHAQLHVFGRCGHWTQLEYADQFAQLVANFLAA